MAAADPQIRAAYERHPELVQLVEEVDRSLIRWSLGLTPLERLRAASKSLRGLRRFKRDSPERS